MARFPAAFAIEVLLSLQVVLFPLDEDKSVALLEQAIESPKDKWDTEIKTYDLDSLLQQEKGEINTDFHYLLNRLVYLHDRAAEAPPTSRIGHFFHPWTHRHMVILTALGIFAAFVVGVVSLGFSIEQFKVAKEELNLQKEANGRGN